jgi:hypothetical protein
MSVMKTVNHVCKWGLAQKSVQNSAVILLLVFGMLSLEQKQVSFQ